MAETTLVLGGARSGKSELAEELVAGYGSKVIYVATAGVWDEEMSRRVVLHRRRRPPGWLTVEETHDPGVVFDDRVFGMDAVMIDCLTLWISNLLLDQNLPCPGAGDGAKEAYILDRAKALVAACVGCPVPVVLVSSEVGAGIVPEHKLARLFRDAAGGVNRIVAGQAHRVIWSVAGIPVEIKKCAKSVQYPKL